MTTVRLSTIENMESNIFCEKQRWISDSVEILNELRNEHLHDEKEYRGI